MKSIPGGTEHETGDILERMLVYHRGPHTPIKVKAAISTQPHVFVPQKGKRAPGGVVFEERENVQTPRGQSRTCRAVTTDLPGRPNHEAEV